MGKWGDRVKQYDDGIAYIQYLSTGGGWVNLSQCLKSDEGVIDVQMTSAKERFPDRPVRAVDQSGMILNLM